MFYACKFSKFFFVFMCFCLYANGKSIMDQSSVTCSSTACSLRPSDLDQIWNDSLGPRNLAVLVLSQSAPFLAWSIFSDCIPRADYIPQNCMLHVSSSERISICFLRGTFSTFPLLCLLTCLAESI